MRHLSLFCLFSLILFNPASAESNRWHHPDKVEQGRSLFRQHCAACHGQNAEATADWKKSDAQGRFPPPPLNGSAHTWHHSLDTLRLTVREGGQKLGGWMPPFGQVLNADQIDSILAFVQSLWPQQTYDKWADRYQVTAWSPVNLDYLRQRLGQVDIQTPRPTRREGIYEIRFDDKTLYITEDGEFAFIGDMIDLKNGINLSKQKRP